jgi:thioesterase domain-containing protein/acyl carrier protein
LGEIEVNLAEHPAIKECAVVVEETEGENQRLIGYYVSESNHTAIPTEELRIFLRKKLPNYMVPFAFVHLDALPLTPNSKLDRQALPGLDKVLNLEKDYVAPRDEVERKLVTLWEELLEISPIGIQNDFFRIGGHSLLAARMIANVEEEFGKMLDLGALAQATTIADLAEVVRGSLGDRKLKSLVAIRASGSKLPLYCVHGVGGHILPFLDLANHLENEQPVYALQAKPVQPGDQRTIEGMALEYVEEVEQFQPDGLYYLAGYSFGGFIAYEMARQIEARGKQVALLALFDTQACSSPRFADSLTHIGFLRYKLRAFMVKVLFKLSEIKFSTVVPNQDGKHNLPNQNEMIFGDVDPDTVPEHLKKIMTVNQAAFSQYIPGHYNGLVTLFKSSIYGRSVYFGWEELTSGGVRGFEVPGTHRTMMQEPNVRILAKQLNQCLESCAKSNTILEKPR